MSRGRLGQCYQVRDAREIFREVRGIGVLVMEAEIIVELVMVDMSISC